MNRPSRLTAAVATALLSLALIAATEPVVPADPYLTDAERQALVEVLERSEKELMALIEGVTGDAWSKKPAPEKWSVGEVAEHLMISEGFIFGTVEQILEGEPNPEWQTATAGKLDIVRSFMSDRGQKVQAPEAAQPKGEMSREEVLEGFRAARAVTLELARTTDKPLEQYVQEHPAPIFGELNALQWLHFLAEHNLRHNQQIVEVKDSLGIE